MKLIKFVANNWLSFKNVEYTFEDGAKQIKGKNLCESDSQDSNGSGKSSFVEGITKCLLNYTSRNEIDRNLVNFDEKEAYLMIEVFCSQRKQTLKIERKFKKKGSSEAQISVNDKIIHAFEDKMVNEIDKFILEWLGMSMADLQNYFFISGNKFVSFFSTSNTQKLQLINRFSNLSLVDKAENNVGLEISRKESTLRVEESKIDMFNGKIQALNELLEKEKLVDIKQEKLDRIVQIEQQSSQLLDSIDEMMIDLGKIEHSKPITAIKLKVREKNLLKLASYKQKYDTSILYDRITKLNGDKSKIEAQLIKLRIEKKDLESVLDETVEMLHEVERNINGSVECPSCHFKFIVGNEVVKISDEIERKSEIKELIELTNGDIDKVKQSIITFTEKQIKPIDEAINKVNIEIRELKQKVNRVAQLEQKYTNTLIHPLKVWLNEVDNSATIINNKISNSVSLIEENNKLINSIKNDKSTVNPKIKEFETSIEEVKLSIQEQLNVVNKVRDEIFELNQWSIRMKRFKMYLATKSLRIVQDYCNKALIDMKSDLRVKLEGFKMNADGKIKEEITPYIYRGDIIRNFGSFSAGERARLEYAMIIALQNVINSTNKYGGLYFLSSDEAIGGLDGLGLDSVIGSLQQFKFPILITSHIQSNFNLDKCIIFVKDNTGVSKIETDTNYLKQIFI